MTTPTSPLLNLEEAAAYIRLNAETFKLWSKDGQVPGPVRIASSEFWRISDLDDWIAQLK